MLIILCKPSDIKIDSRAKVFLRHFALAKKLALKSKQRVG
jgi:hypothetical protein